MVISTLLILQVELLLLMLVGILIRRVGILKGDSLSALSNLCVKVIIPCNIFKSFLGNMNLSVLRQCAQLLLCGICVQMLYYVVNKFLYNGFPQEERRVMQYCTFVPNGGFLGNAVAEGIYGAAGLMMANVFLIPQRILVWSVGPTYFVNKTTSRKELIKTILTHPCLVAVYLGLVVMSFQLPVPRVISGTVGMIGSCNTAMIMIIIGASVAMVNPRTMITPKTLFFCLFRLVLYPLAALGIGRLCGVSGAAMGINLLMAGMPAGTTSVIFAQQYDSDVEFAGKCVLLSTVLSMITLPLWIIICFPSTL